MLGRWRSQIESEQESKRPQIAPEALWRVGVGSLDKCRHTAEARVRYHQRHGPAAPAHLAPNHSNSVRLEVVPVLSGHGDCPVRESPDKSTTPRIAPGAMECALRYYLTTVVPAIARICVTCVSVKG